MVGLTIATPVGRPMIWVKASCSRRGRYYMIMILATAGGRSKSFALKTPTRLQI